MPKTQTYIVDCECFVDFFSVSMLHFETGDIWHWVRTEHEDFDSKEVRRLLKRNRIVTFNGNNYDIPMISAACCGFDNRRLKKVSDEIIVTNRRPWQVSKIFEFPVMSMPNHIDLIEVAPGIATLKIYAGRMHAPTMRDLPFDPDDKVAGKEEEILEYTEIDLQNTELLFRELLPQLKLRNRMGERYGIDLMSKSDAQIAEAVISHELENKIGFNVQKPDFDKGYLFKYKAPAFIRNWPFPSDFISDLVEEIEDDDFIVQDGSGKVLLPKSLRRKTVEIGGKKYRMGIGGLHSSEKCVAYESSKDEFILDFDVASYYPAIIMNCKLYPKHLGKPFLDVYSNIVAERLKAKAAGDKVTAESLKITVNGSFGKFGSRYSILYSPHLLMQTTITGQLALLLLIELVDKANGEVVSANTDGVTVRVARKNNYRRVKAAVKDWETETGFTIEETWYKAIYIRDVNNYLAIKKDGTHKGKGIFAEEAKGTRLAKNPVNPICTKAVVDYLSTGKEIADTINGCDDIRQFVSIRTVKGGAICPTTNRAETTQKIIGKAIRWYYSNAQTGALHYKVNGNKVPRTDGARPLMSLPKKIPDDLDRKWYILECEEILSSIGAGMV